MFFFFSREHQRNLPLLFSSTDEIRRAEIRERRRGDDIRSDELLLIPEGKLVHYNIKDTLNLCVSTAACLQDVWGNSLGFTFTGFAGEEYLQYVH